VEERMERELSATTSTSTVVLGDVDDAEAGDFGFFFFFLEEDGFRAGSICRMK
jgi:hypothetical protein